jgi:S1-C subfamily serine protease
MKRSRHLQLFVGLALLLGCRDTLFAQSANDIEQCTQLIKAQNQALQNHEWQVLIDSGRAFVTYCGKVANVLLRDMPSVEGYALAHIGIGLIELKQYDDAIPVLRRCTSLYPDVAGCHEELGEALYYSNKVEEAKQSLNRCIQIGGYDEVNAQAIKAAKRFLALIDEAELSAPAPRPESVAEEKQPDTHSFGTGFFISAEGHILTNNHVVANCRAVSTRDGHPLELVSRDVRSDLALLKAEEKQRPVAVFRSGGSVRAGDAVTVFGYPLPDLLSSAGNVSTGIVSATSGLGNDIRYIQIGAPVQSGNSGGPLFDNSGHVVGVVVAKLDTLKTAKLTGDVPQNVNFAIHWSEVRAFLDEEGISYRKEPSTKSLTTREIASAAAQITVAIDCTE